MIAQPTIRWIGSLDKFDAGRLGHKPAAIICHISEGTLGSMDSWFNDPRSRGSAHFGIGPDGRIHQYVKLEDTAWHAGIIQRPSWPLLAKYPGANPNRYTFGIEFAGWHTKDSAGRILRADWKPTQAQIKAGAHLIAWLAWNNEIPITRETVAGHYEIDSKDKLFCPGPLFPWDTIIEEAKKLLLKEVITGMFKDMAGHWGRESVERVAGIQLPDGTPLVRGKAAGDGSVIFDPNAPMTRAEVITIIDRVLKLFGR